MANHVLRVPEKKLRLLLNDLGACERWSVFDDSDIALVQAAEEPGEYLVHVSRRQYKLMTSHIEQSAITERYCV